MINPSFQDLAEASSSRYEVCVMVMKRARYLVAGSKPLVKSKGKKAVTVALDEIMNKKVIRECDVENNIDEISEDEE